MFTGQLHANMQPSHNMIVDKTKPETQQQKQQQQTAMKSVTVVNTEPATTTTTTADTPTVSVIANTQEATPVTAQKLEDGNSGMRRQAIIAGVLALTALTLLAFGLAGNFGAMPIDPTTIKVLLGLSVGMAFTGGSVGLLLARTGFQAVKQA